MLRKGLSNGVLRILIQLSGRLRRLRLRLLRPPLQALVLEVAIAFSNRQRQIVEQALTANGDGDFFLFQRFCVDGVDCLGGVRYRHHECRTYYFFEHFLPPQSLQLILPES